MSKLFSAIVFPCVTLLFISTASTDAAFITIKASDTASPRFPSGEDINNDNRLRAYFNGGIPIDGYMAFDLSAISDNSTIDALTLTLFGEGEFATPSENPPLTVYRSAFDAWHRGGSGFSYTLNEQLTPTDLGPFPSGVAVPYSFVLDATAANWQVDLVDNQLTLVLRTENHLTQNWAYWFGSDNPATAPSLLIEYSDASNPVPEPSTFALLGLGGLGLAVAARRRRLAV